jgi:hypothetical protein
MEERIETLHPEGKPGVRISRRKYDVIREAILGVLTAHEDMQFKDLPAEVEATLPVPFDGSIPWYVTTVKLDLEARGLLERVPGTRPQRLRHAQ